MRTVHLLKSLQRFLAYSIVILFVMLVGAGMMGNKGVMTTLIMSDVVLLLLRHCLVGIEKILRIRHMSALLEILRSRPTSIWMTTCDMQKHIAFYFRRRNKEDFSIAYIYELLEVLRNLEFVYRCNEEAGKTHTWWRANRNRREPVSARDKRKTRRKAWVPGAQPA